MCSRRASRAAAGGEAQAIGEPGGAAREQPLFEELDRLGGVLEEAVGFRLDVEVEHLTARLVNTDQGSATRATLVVIVVQSWSPALAIQGL